jgi:hypothetical protein
MTETGWPLIPREVLPAPIAAAAKRRPPPRPQVPDLGRQLPFFGAETTEPSPADLAGLLAGPGRLGRMGGTARVSVEVEDAWRVHVLVPELVVRGLTAQWRPLPADSSAADEPVDPDLLEDGRGDPPHPDAGRRVPAPGELSLTTGRRPAASEEESETTEELGRREVRHKEVEAGQTPQEPEPPPPPRFEVLTAYTRRLNGLARGWPEAATQLFLSGPRLRLWVAAAGKPVPGGYSLGLDPVKDSVAVDAALVRAGLAGRLSDDGRHYLIAGKKRLRRLAELVGERPDAAPERMWPSAAGA